MSGDKTLLFWATMITDGYPGVNVSNFTTSFKDGLAFCAIIVFFFFFPYFFVHKNKFYFLNFFFPTQKINSPSTIPHHLTILSK